MQLEEAWFEKLSYWQDLTPEEQTFVKHHTIVRAYAKGSIIHSGTDQCLGMVLVLSGQLRTYILSEEGREVTLFRLGVYEPCVLSAACVIQQITFETQMVAEHDTTLLVVQAGAFSKLAEQNIHVRCFMFELLTERFSSVMWTMQQILFVGYDRRLAAFLMAEYDRTGLTELKMTHAQIARDTNTAREVVARMLKRFAADGLVTSRRGCIALKNLQALQDLAKRAT